jgi:hypothetical protein
MSSRLTEIFQDQKIIDKIQKKISYLFALAELESSRAGRLGMEVGSLREKILISLLIYKFGKANVDYQLPITEPEIDVKLFGAPISIKTITGLGGVKANWTVDAESARSFIDLYEPKADIMLVQINWNSTGYLFYIPLESQQKVFKYYGKDRYFKLPKAGTNPRGVEFSKDALIKLQNAEMTKKISINWQRPTEKLDLFEAYKRWVEYWGAE